VLLTINQASNCTRINSLGISVALQMLHLYRSIPQFSRFALCSVVIGFSSILPTVNAQQANELPEGIAANVNGTLIPFSMIRHIEQQLNNDEAPTSREDILTELIDLELLTQRAETQKLENKPSVAARLQLQYSQTMANAYLEVLSEELIVSDEQVKAEYDVQTQSLQRSEYRASHILLENEADAIDTIAALDAEQDFATLASERSVGPSASSGGDLGWFDDGTMVAEFTAAINTLEKGEYTRTPVQTQFGWHVIMLNDTRNGQVPDFDSVKAGLRNLMVRNLLNERVEALRDLADIQRVE